MAGLLPQNRDHGWAPYVWLVFLSFFFFQPVLERTSAREWIITAVASVVFVVLYFAVFWSKPPLTSSQEDGLAVFAAKHDKE